MSESKGYLDMELLRFTTAGSVDDGKSTLIGRLLYDSKAIFEDQLEILEETSELDSKEGVGRCQERPGEAWRGQEIPEEPQDTLNPP